MDACFLNNVRLFFLPLGDNSIASSRLRCHMICDGLSGIGYECSKQVSKGYDVLYIQKNTNLLALRLAYECKLKSKVLIFDIDDFPHDNKFRTNAKTISNLADAITTATPEQKKYLCETFNINSNKVFVLENPIDYGLNSPIRKKHFPQKKLRVAWFGNIENFPNRIINLIYDMPDVELYVITKGYAKYIELFPNCNFITWKYDSFSEDMRKIDVCILSHDGDKVIQAKSANKMVTAIMHGVPAIASKTPDYFRLAKSIGVEEYLFENDKKLIQILELMREPRNRNKYISKTQNKIYKAFNIKNILNTFILIIQYANENKKDFNRFFLTINFLNILRKSIPFK